MSTPGRLLVAVSAMAGSLALASCGGGGTPTGVVNAIGVEAQYANVISEIGGRYVHAVSIVNNPNTDPHDFEVNASIAQEISGAELIVQNGLGYDAWMGPLESSDGVKSEDIITVQRAMGLSSSLKNPHLWYDTGRMSRVASAIERVLDRLRPSHRAYFARRTAAFDRSLAALGQQVARDRQMISGAAVAVTEPVADDLITELGLANATPFRLQAAIMNGVDPAPEDVTTEQALLSDRGVKVFCYNVQVVDSFTASLLSLARTSRVPVVAVYEIMPKGLTYVTWMHDEATAITQAVLHDRSTTAITASKG